MTSTYKLDKQTAKDICAIRKAQHAIDKIELNDGYGYRPPDSPNVAYLMNGSMLPPFRCDIVAKWAAIADNQRYMGIMQPDPTIYFTPNPDNGEVTLRCGQSSVRLYPVDQGFEKPIHTLPITIEGDTIKLAVSAKEITDKAKALTSNAARIKREKELTAKAAKAHAEQVEYERCKAIVTPDAVARCVKRVKRLRTLQTWLRAVDKALDAVPSLPQLVSDPLFNAFDPAYAEAYGDARLQWIEASKKRDNFKPRSWRSKGLEKHNENVQHEFRGARQTALNALEHNVRAAGFSFYGCGASDHREYNENDVRRCRKYIRSHESEVQP